MEMKNVKGSYDYGINEERVRSYIRNTLAKVFVKYGYQGIETPIINYYDLMALKYNDDAEILNEVYKLSDQGGRKLALRYDLTVPFAKYIAMNKDLVLPFKRFEMGNVFRDGPVKVGRNREFIQCDVDVVGLDNRMIEAELMALYIEGYKALDIDVVLKYNNRKIMQGMIENEGITGDKVSDVITVIDKFDKLTPQEIKIEFTNVGLDSDTITNLLEVFKLDFDGIKNKYKDNDNINLIEGIEEIEELNTYILNNEMGAFEFNFYVAKKLKELENKNREWDVKRLLTKNNYLIHTDAIKNYILPDSNYYKNKEWLKYAEEADILNVVLFNTTAREWRELNPTLAKKFNIRDYATMNELICLANLENLNSVFIKEGLIQSERLIKLNKIAISQIQILNDTDIKCLK